MHVGLWHHLHHMESLKMNCQQNNLMVSPLCIVSGGMRPNRHSHKITRSPLLTLVMSSSSTGRPSSTTASLSVIVAFPSGRWKVRIFVLHLSTKTMSKWWLISIWVNVRKWPNLAGWIKILTELSSLSWSLIQQITCHRGLSNLLLPFQIAFVTYFCWSYNNDISAKRRWLYIIYI